MKTATTHTKSFKLDENHRLTVRKRETGTNYNTFAHVFVNGSKDPEFGTSFSENTPIEEIISWANNHINNPPKNDFMKTEKPKRYRLLTQAGYPENELRVGNIYSETCFENAVRGLINSFPEDWELVTDEPEPFKPTHEVTGGEHNGKKLSNICVMSDGRVKGKTIENEIVYVSLHHVYPINESQTTLTEQQYDSLKKAIYNVIMNSNDELGMAGMGECELLAQNTVKTWAEQNNIKLP